MTQTKSPLRSLDFIQKQVEQYLEENKRTTLPRKSEEGFTTLYHAIQRYHGGILSFAKRHNYTLEPIVKTKPTFNLDQFRERLKTYLLHNDFEEMPRSSSDNEHKQLRKYANYYGKRFPDAVEEAGIPLMKSGTRHGLKLFQKSYPKRKKKTLVQVKKTQQPIKETITLEETVQTVPTRLNRIDRSILKRYLRTHQYETLSLQTILDDGREDLLFLMKQYGGIAKVRNYMGLEAPR